MTINETLNHFLLKSNTFSSRKSNIYFNIRKEEIYIIASLPI